MILYFNKNGQLLEKLDYPSGAEPRVGMTTFQIFAFFEGLDMDDYGAAIIRFRRPDLEGSEYPNLLMTGYDFNYDSQIEASSYFNDEHGSYRGYLFNFNSIFDDDTNAIVQMLDTPGIWEASITLVTRGNGRNVTGLVTFAVGGAVSEADEEPQELSGSVITNNIIEAITTKVDTTDSFYVRKCDDFLTDAEAGELLKQVYVVGAVVLDKATNCVYVINAVEDRPGTEKVYVTDYELLENLNGVSNYNYNSSTKISDMLSVNAFVFNYDGDYNSGKYIGYVIRRMSVYGFGFNKIGDNNIRFIGDMVNGSVTLGTVFAENSQYLSELMKKQDVLGVVEGSLSGATVQDLYNIIYALGNDIAIIKYGGIDYLAQIVGYPPSMYALSCFAINRNFKYKNTALTGNVLLSNFFVDDNKINYIDVLKKSFDPNNTILDLDNATDRELTIINYLGENYLAKLTYYNGYYSLRCVSLNGNKLFYNYDLVASSRLSQFFVSANEKEYAFKDEVFSRTEALPFIDTTGSSQLTFGQLWNKYQEFSPNPVCIKMNFFETTYIFIGILSTTTNIDTVYLKGILFSQNNPLYFYGISETFLPLQDLLFIASKLVNSNRFVVSEGTQTITGLKTFNAPTDRNGINIHFDNDNDGGAIGLYPKDGHSAVHHGYLLGGESSNLEEDVKVLFPAKSGTLGLTSEVLNILTDLDIDGDTSIIELNAALQEKIGISQCITYLEDEGTNRHLCYVRVYKSGLSWRLLAIELNGQGYYYFSGSGVTTIAGALIGTYHTFIDDKSDQEITGLKTFNAPVDQDGARIYFQNDDEGAAISIYDKDGNGDPCAHGYHLKLDESGSPADEVTHYLPAKSGTFALEDYKFTTNFALTDTIEDVYQAVSAKGKTGEWVKVKINYTYYRTKVSTVGGTARSITIIEGDGLMIYYYSPYIQNTVTLGEFKSNTYKRAYSYLHLYRHTAIRSQSGTLISYVSTNNKLFNPKYIDSNFSTNGESLGSFLSKVLDVRMNSSSAILRRFNVDSTGAFITYLDDSGNRTTFYLQNTNNDYTWTDTVEEL